MKILRVKEVMNQKGISRDSLAEAVGVSPTTISNICSETNLPTLKLLMDIGIALDVDVRELFIGTKEGVLTRVEVDKAKELISMGLKILS
jgi:DNA-binding XRE family transcriptional regulator